MFNRALLLCYMVLFNAIASSAQPDFQNLNSFSGLPSDHIYFILKDKNGYLWLSTDKGVAKYNGYELKVFTVADGLINDDVYSMYEDRQGRIWLHALADNIGYVRNNVFHAAYITNTARFLRPYDMHSTPSGVVFSNFVPWCLNELYFEANDTFYAYSVVAKSKDLFFFDELTGKVLASRDQGIYESYPEQKQILKQASPYQCSIPYKKEYSFHSYHIVQSYNNKLTAYNFRNGITTALALSQTDEKLYNYYGIGNNLFVITDKRILIYDTLLLPVNTYILSGIIKGVDMSTQTLVCFFEDDFWGRAAGTLTSGAYIQKPRYFSLPDLASNEAAADFKNPDFNGQENRTLQLLNSLRNKPARLVLKNTYSDLVASSKKIRSLNDIRGLESPIQINNYIYLISPAFGFCKIYIRSDTIKIEQINDRRYNLLRYDSLRNLIYLARSDEVLVYETDRRNCSFTFTKQHLNKLGIRKVNDILIDKYGDVFVKDQTELFLYNASTHTFKERLKSFNLENTTAQLYSDTLIVVGNIGISGYKVHPDGHLQNCFHYINNGYSQYKKVYQWRFFQNKLELITDRGQFKIPISSITESNSPRQPKANFTITEKGAIKNVRANDTILISQDNLLLEWDVILPHPTGKPQFNYTINEKYRLLNWSPSKAIFLSGLSPGVYHTVLLKCKDDIWKYEQPLTIYIKPFLWQTRKGISLIGAMVMGVLMVLFFAGVYISKKRATKRLEKRNLQLQLHNAKLNTELKSIYAQINPHFIFNTLSTTAYFIKHNENKKAVNHLVAFSKLLRAYIRSSREKFITLREELDNIENYLLLQQTRYEDMFSYELQVHDTVDLERKIPAFLIQPLVENAINHGLVHKEGPGLLKISLYPGDINGELYCVIDDNGIGRKASRAYYAESGLKPASYGSELINELIAMINSSNKMHIDILYEDKSVPESGTIVTIKITNSYETTT